jgi:hypothetical protein
MAQRRLWSRRQIIAQPTVKLTNIENKPTVSPYSSRFLPPPSKDQSRPVAITAIELHF